MTKDPAATVKFYTDDSVMLPQDAPIAEGQDAIAKVWRGYFDLPDFSLTFSPTKINVSSSGDMAYEIGRYALGFRGDKGLVQEKGKYVVVWKKVGGTWKAAADIFNSDRRSPNGTEAGFDETVSDLRHGNGHRRHRGRWLRPDAATTTLGAVVTKPVATTPAAKQTRVQKAAISKACSEEADAKNLHGKERKDFRAECMRSGGKPS